MEIINGHRKIQKTCERCNRIKMQRQSIWREYKTEYVKYVCDKCGYEKTFSGSITKY